MAQQRPTWLVIVRYGGIVAAIGLVIAIVGGALSFGALQFGLVVTVTGIVGVIAGIIYRFAANRR